MLFSFPRGHYIQCTVSRIASRFYFRRRCWVSSGAFRTASEYLHSWESIFVDSNMSMYCMWFILQWVYALFDYPVAQENNLLTRFVLFYCSTLLKPDLFQCSFFDHIAWFSDALLNVRQMCHISDQAFSRGACTLRNSKRATMGVHC